MPTACLLYKTGPGIGGLPTGREYTRWRCAVLGGGYKVPGVAGRRGQGGQTAAARASLILGCLPRRRLGLRLLPRLGLRLLLPLLPCRCLGPAAARRLAAALGRWPLAWLLLLLRLARRALLMGW